jgi:hypothetical protein
VFGSVYHANGLEHGRCNIARLFPLQKIMNNVKQSVGLLLLVKPLLVIPPCGFSVNGHLFSAETLQM